jgi:hypothetical protein
MGKSDVERHRWRGSEYAVTVREENGRHVSEVLRREPGAKEFKPVKGSKQTAASKAEAKYLGEHRKQIVREGDALH